MSRLKRAAAVLGIVAAVGGGAAACGPRPFFRPPYVQNVHNCVGDHGLECNGLFGP